MYGWEYLSRISKKCSRRNCIQYALQFNSMYMNVNEWVSFSLWFQTFTIQNYRYSSASNFIARIVYFMYVHIAMFGLVRFLMALKKLYFNSEALYRSFTHKNVFIFFFQTFPALRYAMLHKRGNWYTVFYICLKTYRNYLETTGKHLSILLLLRCDEATTYHIYYIVCFLRLSGSVFTELWKCDVVLWAARFEILMQCKEASIICP